MARAPIDARSDRADPHQTPCPGIARGRPMGTLIHTSWSLSAIELAVCSALSALITHARRSPYAAPELQKCVAVRCLPPFVNPRHSSPETPEGCANVRVLAPCRAASSAGKGPLVALLWRVPDPRAAPPAPRQDARGRGAPLRVVVASWRQPAPSWSAPPSPPASHCH